MVDLVVPSDPEEQLIQQIYAAAYDPTQWVGVMEKLAEATGGLRGCLSRIDMDTRCNVEAILLRSDPAWVDAFGQHFSQINVFTAADDPSVRDPRRVITDEDCVSRDDYHASEFYNDFMRPQEVDRSLFIRVGRAGSIATNINIGHREGGAFESSDLELAARLQPHMARSYQISLNFPLADRVQRHLSDALQHSPHAVFLVDADCALAHANAAGERLLARDRGLILVKGRLTPAQSDAARRFEALVGQAAHRTGLRVGGTMSVPRPGARFPLALRTAPLPLDDGPIFRASAPVLVCVTDLEADVVTPARELQDLFGLTAAEVRLAAAVFEGLTLPEAAEKFGVSTNTVRFQLARIFDKTGVSRQAELVKLIMRVAGNPAG